MPRCPTCQQPYDQENSSSLVAVPLWGCSRCGTVLLPDRVLHLTLEGQELAYAAMEWLDLAQHFAPRPNRKKKGA